jgi:hypothetical protein
MAEFDLHLDGRVMSASFPKLRRLGVGKTKRKYTPTTESQSSVVWTESKRKKRSQQVLSL